MQLTRGFADFKPVEGIKWHVTVANRINAHRLVGVWNGEQKDEEEKKGLHGIC